VLDRLGEPFVLFGNLQQLTPHRWTRVLRSRPADKLCPSPVPICGKSIAAHFDTVHAPGLAESALKKG